MAKTPDGRIWFAAFDGVSVIDPHLLPHNDFPPPVHIEQIIADRRAHDPANGLRLHALSRDLQIDYTALSLVAPEKIRFKLKLEGYDREWLDAGNRRQAFYSNLPPRAYRFRVIAGNNTGVWNEAGDSIQFEILPAWYQRFLFRALMVAAFLACLFVAYLIRVHQLRQEEAKFREAVESMPAVAFITLQNGERRFVNKPWVEYTGLATEKALGSGWLSTVHPDDVNRVREKWRSSLGSTTPLDYEARYRRSDGHYRWFHTRVIPVRDRRGKILKWCGAATDIEDRKRAEQLQAELAHVNRVSTMGELAASISHELNQPIAGSILNASLALHWLENEPADLKQARERTKQTIESCTMASEIIDRLRSLYRKEPPKRELLSVNEVIANMVELLRGQATRHGVSIRADLTADLPARNLLLVILRTGIEQGVEFKPHVVQPQGTVASDTSAVPRELSGITFLTGDGFAVTKGGNEFWISHDFPLDLGRSFVGLKRADGSWAVRIRDDSSETAGSGGLHWCSPAEATAKSGVTIVSWRGTLRVPQGRLRDRSRGHRGRAQTGTLRK